MNFSYGVIAAVGVLVAISIGLISAAPGDIPEPRQVSIEEPKPEVCTMQWDPMCGVDGETYGNMCMLNAADVKLDYQGECVVAEPEPEPQPEPEPEPQPEPEPEPQPEPEPEPVEEVPAVSMPTAPQSHIVETAIGSATPGCEETDECYLPYSITINVGDTVLWNNPDSAAHTVTSGNIADGHDGLFDSSLFMSGASFEYTFDESGTYDYFCMVHPWMTGEVVVGNVDEMVVIEEPEPEPEPEPESSETLPMSLTISLPDGSGIPGCESTNECYIPYEVTVAVGATITWSNDDTAAHTVTSGNPQAGATGVFDSGLFMAEATFDHTFDTAGTYDYFCMVHPWMIGIVHVE